MVDNFVNDDITKKLVELGAPIKSYSRLEDKLCKGRVVDIDYLSYEVPTIRYTMKWLNLCGIDFEVLTKKIDNKCAMLVKKNGEVKKIVKHRYFRTVHLNAISYALQLID